MARIVIIDQSDYRLVVQENGTITFDVGLGGEVHITGKFVGEADGEIKNLLIQEDLEINGGDITSTAASFNLFKENVSKIDFGNAATDIQIGSTSGITTVNNNLQVDLDAEVIGDLTVQKDLEINGGDITSTSSSFNILKENVTTIDFGNTATDIQIGSTSGITTINNNLQVDLDAEVIGDLTVQKDLEINGGDITSTSSSFNILKENVTTIDFGNAATDIQIGSESGITTVNNNLQVDLDAEVIGDLTVQQDLEINGGDITSTATSFNLFKENVTTIDFGNAATDIQIGSESGITTVNNNLQVDLDAEVIGDLTVQQDLEVNGGDITSTSSSFNLFKENVTTIDFGNAATDIQIGATSGITTINNNLQVDLDAEVIGDLTVQKDLEVNGGDITSTSSSFNILKENVSKIDFGNAATDIQIGATSGITTVNNNLQVDLDAEVIGDLTVQKDLEVNGGDITSTSSSFNLFKENVSKIDFGNAAIDIQIGATSGITTVNNNLQVDLDAEVIGDLTVQKDLEINGGDITSTTTSFNLFKENVSKIDFGNAATDIQIGSESGITTINNNLQVDLDAEVIGDLTVQQDLEVNGGDITSTSSSFNILKENVSKIDFGNAATDIQIGATSGITTINNNLQVDLDAEVIGDLTVQQDLEVNGGDITSTSSSFNILKENVSKIDFGNAATDIQIGSESGITTVNNNLQVDGNTYLAKHTVIGTSNTDSVTFISDVTSNITPNVSETYTLGVPNKAWEALYTNKISNEFNKNISINTQGNGLVEINSSVNIEKNLSVNGITHILGDLFTSGKSYGTFPIVPNILYVTTEGSDTNDGTAMDPSRACRTITGAIRSPYYRPGTSIKVAPGRYLEDNPLLLKPYTSVIGSDLRTTTIEPINKTQDIFHVTSSTYIAQMQFLNGRSGIIDPMIDRGAYTVAFPNTSFTFTGTVTHGLTIITDVQLTQFIAIGAEINGTYEDKNGDIKNIFPTGTIIISIDNLSQISVSRKAFLDITVEPGVTPKLSNISLTTGLLTIYKSPYIQNCTNQSGPWLKDGTMFIPNQTVQVPIAVGTASFSENQESIRVSFTKGSGNNLVSGMKINTAPQHLGFFHARTLILANKSFMQEQVVAWIARQIELENNNPGSIWYNFKDTYTPYVQEKCRRDVGIILENILYDVCFGGNSKTIEAGLAYYKGVVSIISGQTNQTIASLEYLNSLVNSIIKNELITTIIRPTLENVIITEIGELGEIEKKFNCKNIGITLLPGRPIEISGILTGTGNINGYVNPTTYYIDTTNGRTEFTLRDSDGVIVDISAGTTNGLTFTYGLTQVLIPFLGNEGSFAENVITNSFNIINEIIEDGPSKAPKIYYSTGPEFGLVCAELLLQENREFLQKEVSAFIDKTYPFLFFNTTNENVCKRDIVTIVNAVLDDIIFDTNYRSLISGIAYTRSYSSNVTISQKKQTITALNIARDLIKEYTINDIIKLKIDNNFKIITDIIEDNGDYASPELYFSNPLNIDINQINAARLLEKNKPFLIAEIMAWINYQIENDIGIFADFSLDNIQKIKCSRDTGYFIDALIYDLLYGGNSQCVSAANAYFLGTNSYISNQESQTVAVYTYLRSIISNIVQGILIIPTTGNNDVMQYTIGPKGSNEYGILLQNLLTDITNIIDPNYLSNISIIPPNYETGINYTSMYNDIVNIKNELEGIDSIQNRTITQFKLTYNLKSKCERDIGYIVDAISQDILLGGNSKSIDAAITYYNALGFVANSEAEYTAQGFEYAKILMLSIIQNTPIVASAYNYPYQIIKSQSINSNSEYAKGTIAQDAVSKNINIIIDIIRTGIKDRYVRYQGTSLFTATGVSADDVKESTEIESIVNNGDNTYTITLSKPTVGIGANSTLYFGYSDVYPLTDDMVEDRCESYGFDRNSWDQRKYDPYGSMGGMLIDGAVISAESPIRSFVADAYTQVNQGGRGVRATRRGYVQLVSVFTIFSSISMQTDSGAIMSITNANANFGDYCMISKGYGPKEFSGTVYNPASLPLYPSGRYPSDGNINIFVPDTAYRPHISLIMEVEPPENYINVQNKPGFLTATVTTSEIIEGSLTIDNIEVFNMYIGQVIYIKDQYGSYVDEDLGLPYLEEGTTIVDLGPSTIYLSRPINRGKNVPNNPAFFTIFTCGKAYYTVLTSKPAALPTRSDGTILRDGELVLPSNQKTPELLSITRIKELINKIIVNEPVTNTKQQIVKQVINTVYNGSTSITRVNYLINLIYNIINYETDADNKNYLIKNNIEISKSQVTPSISDNGAAALILLNLNFIAAEIEALVEEYKVIYDQNNQSDFTYNKNKCLRDSKLIASKVAEDLTTGGNYNSCYSGLSYIARNGTYHIVSLNDNVRDTGLFQDGSIVNFYQRSYMTASGYLFEYVGAGSNYGALPTVGRADPIQGREVNMLDGGKVFFTSTDQNGDFRIGPGLVINQAAGVLSGRTFQKSLFAEMTPFILALE